MGSRKVPRGLRGRHVVKEHQRKLRTSRGSPRHVRICTAKASGISRETVKSGCAREWGGWGRISEDGPGQQNPDRSEGPWGRAGSRLHGGAHQRIAPDTEPGIPVAADSTKDGSKPACWEAPSEIPALKPYRGKPAVRNFRGGNGDVGIIRSPVRAIALPDCSLHCLVCFAP